MKNSVSDRNLFIESEEDDDVDEEEEHKAQPSRAADDDDSDGSDSSSSPDDDDDDGPPRSRPNSYSTNWPQSYRYPPFAWIDRLMRALRSRSDGGKRFPGYRRWIPISIRWAAAVGIGWYLARRVVIVGGVVRRMVG